MIAFGVKCAGCIERGHVVFLEGDLGAGKTTFAKGVLSGLGYLGAVTSPTFSLLESYELAEMTVHHFDLYRMESPDELEMIGARELFTPNSLCLIEWPEKAVGFLPEPDLRISIEYRPSSRQIRIAGKEEQNMMSCLQQLENG